MLQKLLVGMLGFTVIGATGVGIYDSTQTNTDNMRSVVLADLAQNDPGRAPQAAPPLAPTLTPLANAISGAQDGTGPVLLQQQALDMVGDPWIATGTITAFDTAGVTLALSDGSPIYVELGPSHYWQAQPVTLAVGDVVTVTGFYNGDQYHAATVTKADGSQLIVRTVDGLPLWSGGASSGQNQQGAANGTATRQGEPQVAPEDWVTLNATVTAVNRSTLTVQTEAGETLSLQLGQASFIQSQGVTFAVGDALSVTGYWQGTTFRAGDITKLATGERVMLLDPNGRPLWGGPGRAGAQGAQSVQSAQGGGNGRDYRGGRQ